MKKEPQPEEMMVEAPPAPELFTLKELAARHNQLAPKALDGCAYKADHACAAVHHKWVIYDYHSASPLKLSDSDYLAALEAAKLNLTHAPAVAPL
jgi:hypothetical protein